MQVVSLPKVPSKTDMPGKGDLETSRTYLAQGNLGERAASAVQPRIGSALAVLATKNSDKIIDFIFNAIQPLVILVGGFF